ncbi:MAG TPA: hypothetical protein VEX63_00645 [Flavisolibacter sp.]|nr:hypothetical protein [Flavisolibacter sp.]
MRYIIIFFMCISLNGFAQYKSYIIGAKGDTLNRVDMKGLKQGPWVIKVESVRGERGYEEEGIYKDDKKTGTWRMFSLEGDLMAVENYRWGQRDGRNVYLNQMGEPVREEAWRAIDPQNPYDTVNVYDLKDPSKVIGKQVVKVEGLTVKHGNWKYFGPNGRIEKTERYVMDKLKINGLSDDDDLAPIDVTASANGEAKADDKKPVVKKPQAILEYEKKNAGKKKIKVRDGNTGG